MTPPADPDVAALMEDNARLVAELDRAEAYEQRLRRFFVDIRAALAAGHHATALSMLNEALSYVDNATDVVAPHAGGDTPD